MTYNRCLQLVILFILVFALSSLVSAVSFSSAPRLSDTNLSTTQDFRCEFTPLGVGSLTANVTWYVDGVSWADNDESIAVTSGVAAASSYVDASDTAKNEFWRCEVTLSNTTVIVAVNSSQVEVQNTAPIIHNPPTPPVTSAGSYFKVYEDTAYSFFMTASDPDLDSIDWFTNDKSKGNYGGLSLFDILTTGQVVFEHTNEVLVGNHTIAFSAYDEGDSGSIRDIIFELVAVDDAPVINSSSLVYTCNETEVCSGAIIATDEDNGTGNLTFSFNESFINPSSDGTFSFTPNYQQAIIQNWSIEVNVTDGNSVVTEILNMTILTTNHEPNMTYVNIAGSQEDALYTFYINITDSLDPQDVFFFDVTSVCGGGLWSIENVTNGTGSTTALGMINTSLYGNDYVRCRNITILVAEFDEPSMIQKGLYEYDIVLDISNRNDAPVINELSVLNTQQNMSDQFAALGLSFSYLVNATDVDMLTYEGDALVYALENSPTFANGSALFVIDALTGNVSSVQTAMNASYAGLHNLTIVVNDSLIPTLTVRRNLTLNVSFNYPPVINFFNSSMCNETFLCLKNISANDSEHSKSFLVLNSLNFTNPNNISRSDYTSEEIASLLGVDLDGVMLNDTTFYWINFTPDDLHVGAYELNLSFFDNVGNENTTVIYFNISNTNEAPFFDDDLNHSTIENISFGIVAETLPFMKYIYFGDPDLYYGLDNLTFNFSFVNTSLANFSIEQINNSHALINYTPDSFSAGNYSINLSLTDAFNVTTLQIVNFTLYDTSYFPNITNVTPFVLGNGSTTTDFSSINDSDSHVNVSFSENETVVFDFRVQDKDNASMNVSWYVDGVLNYSNTYNPSNPSSSLTKAFSFFDNGTYNITVIVEDIGFDRFTWNVTVGNVNRPPISPNVMENLTGNAAIRGAAAVYFTNFFKLYWDAKIVFYDPDDDVNSDGEVRTPEVSNLVFSVNESGGCDELASFVFTGGDNVTITPLSTGTCATTFIAVDSFNQSVESSEVELEIIKIQSSSGSSSSSSSTTTITETVTVEVEEDVYVPEPFKLIFPDETLVYENSTVQVPIVLSNSRDENLVGVSLFVNDSENNLTYEFSKSYFASIPSGYSETLLLTLFDYRKDQPFEFNVTAKIGSPDYTDSATIYVNALERGKEDLESLKSRIGYARDLLSDNPECAELVEILDQAESNARSSSLEVINNVINGCKYLIGEVDAPSSALPKSFTGRLSVYGKTVLDYDLLWIVLGSLIGGAILISIIARFTLKKI